MKLGNYHLIFKLFTSGSEEREIVPVGGNEVIPIDVRVVCATHKNLEEDKEGKF